MADSTQDYNKSPQTDLKLAATYLDGVGEVFQYVCSDVKITTAVKRLVSEMIEDLFHKMVQRSVTIAGTGGLRPSHVRQAVDTMMGSNLAFYANSEGAMSVMMYEAGFLLFPTEDDDTAPADPQN